MPQLFELLAELAEADSNLPQALRAHFAFVEDRLNAPDGPERDRWFERFLDGELVGSGWTEIGGVKLGQVNTWHAAGRRLVAQRREILQHRQSVCRLIDVYAERSDNGGPVIALVNVTQPGVERDDDWDGFGQRTTGSGTTRFIDAQVEQAHVYAFAERFRYQTAFYQHVLLATLAGIGRAVLRDVGEGVRQRKRIYSHGNAGWVKDDADPAGGGANQRLGLCG